MALEIFSNISLRDYNTFGIDVHTRTLYETHHQDEIKEALEYERKNTQEHPVILGGGSNVLFTSNLSAAVIKVKIKGIEILSEDENNVWLKVGAGEVWHSFVMHCVNNNWAGIENLSLIPGLVGASPMQNIGAYGVEVKDVLYEVHAINRLNGELVIFPASACALGYRASIFKEKYKNQFVICDVVFKLNKKPKVNTSYGAIKQELEKMKINTPTIKDVSNAVIHIRQSKLPDPKKIGNAGSFFKNPFISSDSFHLLKNKFPELVGYDLGNGQYKVAAGWLIEQCGWKGFRRGDVGCHNKQALVLVNFGKASGKEILELCSDIQKSVMDRFNIHLVPEVNVID